MSVCLSLSVCLSISLCLSLSVSLNKTLPFVSFSQPEMNDAPEIRTLTHKPQGFVGERSVEPQWSSSICQLS